MRYVCTYLHTSLASLFGALADVESPSELKGHEAVLQRMPRMEEVEEAMESSLMILTIWRQ